MPLSNKERSRRRKERLLLKRERKLLAALANQRWSFRAKAGKVCGEFVSRRKGGCWKEALELSELCVMHEKKLTWVFVATSIRVKPPTNYPMLHIEPGEYITFQARVMLHHKGGFRLSRMTRIERDEKQTDKQTQVICLIQNV